MVISKQSPNIFWCYSWQRCPSRELKKTKRKEENQKIVYNDHKKVYPIKLQPVVAPNGLIANLFGPVEGKRHGSSMLGDSGLLREFQQHVHGPNRYILCISGEPVDPVEHLWSGYLET